jgi:UDP-glucuronate 4-epimerase
VRALVTGCAGFIGSHLTESLLSDGIPVIGVDCFNDNYARPQKIRNLERAQDWPEFDFVPIDLSRGELSDVAEAVDVIYHLAAEPGVRQSWGTRFEAYVRNNVIATEHLLGAAVRGRYPRLVYASSSSVYGNAARFPTREDVPANPVSPYGVTKLGGELLCLAYHANFGVEAVLLRYFSVYGPRQRPDMAFSKFFNAMLSGLPLEVFGTGEQTRDFTFVTDVVAATRAAAVAPDVAGRVFNIGGGSRTPLNRVLEIVAELTGQEPNVIRHEQPAGDVRDSAADIAAATRWLDYGPAVSLEEGLRRQWEWTLAERDPVGAPPYRSG